MSKVFSALSGDGLKARFMRSSSWSILNFGGAQILRLASNLLLTRLLFPEAFGLMALVMVFLTGLAMFSDTGIVAAIQQNKRGDDPVFLDTARTIQIIRGGLLWVFCLPLGWAISVFYDAPLLAWLLPVAGVTLLIDGFKPTRSYTAQRHLQIGRLTVAELIASAVSVVVTCLLAWWLNSVWALIWGMIAGNTLKLGLLYALLEGRKDRLQIDRGVLGELFHFGKWIFLSTICGFLNSQGDRLILGKFLTLEVLGVYNIAFFLGGFPLLLGKAVFSKVMLPYFREKPPGQSRANFLAYRRLRLLMTGSLITISLIFALGGPHLVSFLYDARYSSAGGMVILVVLASLPNLLLQGYAKVSLSKGDSRSYAIVFAIRSFLNITGLLIGASYGGLVGALIGLGMARVAHYPFVTGLARRYGAWDPKLDAALAAYGLLGAGAALTLHSQAVLDLLPL